MREFIKYAAVCGIDGLAALFGERLELLLQALQLTDAHREVANMLVDQPVDLATLGLRCVLETQELPDLVPGDGQMMRNRPLACKNLQNDLTVPAMSAVVARE